MMITNMTSSTTPPPTAIPMISITVNRGGVGVGEGVGNDDGEGWDRSGRSTYK